MQKILAQLAAEIRIRPEQVKTAVELLDGGATVPFIARYRKEVTGGLDDIQLRELESRLGYLRELEDRRAAVIKSITEQGKMTPELLAAIDAAPTKQELEDIYLPFKPKRRTKGMIAREAGIEPLADKLFANPQLVPMDEARAYVLKEKTEAGDDFTTVLAAAGKRVLLIDDLVATGGTLAAGASLMRTLGALVHECACVIELPELRGREKLGGIPLYVQVEKDEQTEEEKKEQEPAAGVGAFRQSRAGGSVQDRKSVV